MLVLLVLTRRLLLVPPAEGVDTLHHHLVHPGERMREQHGSLKESHVSPVLGEHEHHVGFLLCGQREEPLERRRASISPTPPSHTHFSQI